MPSRAAATVSARLAALELERLAALPPAIPPYRKHLADFIREVFPDFTFSAHTRRLIDIGEAIIAGDLAWVMIELPPRHFKSTVFSRFMPGCYLRRNPNHTVGLGAYSQTLAEEFGQAARDYYLASGGTLHPSSQGKGRWTTYTGLGGEWVAGVGKGTGMPAHLLGLDDPVKGREEADSAAFRRQLHNWLDTVLFTRLEPGARGWVTHTRWHEADGIGYLLSKNSRLEREGLAHLARPWHVISLPMIATGTMKQLPVTCTREPETRQPGQVLDPSRFDLDWAIAQRATMPERDWEAIYQQSPSPQGGTVFQRETLRFYIRPGEQPLDGDSLLPPAFGRVIASVDCSFKNTAGADMVAMTLWGQDGNGMWLLDMINQRMDFPDTLNTIRAMAAPWAFTELLVEDKANGSAVIDTLKREAAGYMVVACNPYGGKIPRANAATPQFHQGRVFLPRHAAWLPIATGQLLKFPADDYDDIVDSITQALNYAAGTGPMRISTATYGRGNAAAPEQQANPLDTVDTTGAIDWRNPAPKPLSFR